MHRTWKRLLIAVLIVTAASPAFADRRDHRDRRHDRHDRREMKRAERRAMRAPPPVRQERWKPRRGYVWVNGHWDWRGSDWVWVSGRYERERSGFRYREPTWVQQGGAWVAVDGGWVAMGPTVAPPPPRQERWKPRRGYVWVDGHWDWRGNRWTWVPGRYERERLGHVYRAPRWEQRGGVYVNVSGGWVVR